VQNRFNLENIEGRLEFSRYVASEGIVLLKNEENVLPLGSEKVAVFGVTQLTSQGSNDGTRLDRSRAVGLTEAMINNGVNIDTDLYNMYLQHVNSEKSHSHGEWGSKHSGNELELSEVQVSEAKARGAEKAIIIIGRASGENSDIAVEKGDYLLSDAENNMIKTVCSVFSDVILLLHIGCNIDLGFLDENNIKGILYLNQLGQNGSLGMADILTGKVSPSGKLTFSMAKHFEDYSSSRHFGQHNGGLLQDYLEDIYIGYRYFETFEGADKNLVYPFGFGLSYTDFEISGIEYKYDGKISVSALVTNIGKVAGKQVVQLYYSVPDIEDGAVLSGPKKQLCGFEKTKLLKPNDSQRVTIEISPEDMASYDDLGVLGEKSCFVLEKGVYKLLLGTDSRNLKVAGEYEEKENRIVEHCHTIPTTLSKRLNRKGEYDILPEPQFGKDRYYAISSMEETVLKAVNCCDRDITDFSELKAGESVTYRLLPGSGGGYYVSFMGENGEDILSDISEGMFDALSGKGGDEIVSEKDIRKYIKKNIDEIVDIIDDNIETDLSKAEIEDEILANVDDIAYEISENCPTADEIAEEIDPGMRAVFSFVTGGTLLLICIIFTLIVAVGLYFLRFKYLRGFIWVGSSGLAVSIFSFISGLSSSLIVALLEGEVYYEADLAFINSFIDIISGKFIFAGAIVGVVSLILLLVGIIVGNILKKKSKEKILRTAVPNATIPN